MITTGRFLLSNNELALLVHQRPRADMEQTTVQLESVDGLYEETGYLADVTSLKMNGLAFARESAFAAKFLPAKESLLMFRFSDAGSIEGWHRERAIDRQSVAA